MADEKFEFRKMRRFKQQLEREECEAILDEARRGTLAVMGEGGYPYAIPMNFVREGDKLYFHSAREGHKIDAITAYDKASFATHDDGVREEGQWWYVVRSVICFGRIRQVEDPTEIERILWLFGDKNSPNADYTAHEIEKDGPRVAILELAIEHMTGKTVNER